MFILCLVYALHWPEDGCFTAETCSSDVIDMSSLCWCTCVLDGNIHIFATTQRDGTYQTKLLFVYRRFGRIYPSLIQGSSCLNLTYKVSRNVSDQLPTYSANISKSVDIKFAACPDTPIFIPLAHLCASVRCSGVPRGVWGDQALPAPRNSEGLPKSCQTQSGCENC